jgi:predicted P-loop ATPase
MIVKIDTNTVNEQIPDNACPAVNETPGIKIEPRMERCAFPPIFTMVTYATTYFNGERILVSKKLNEFAEGELEKVNVRSIKLMSVKENLEPILKYYGCDVKYNVVSRTCDVFQDGKLVGKLPDNKDIIKEMCQSQKFKATRLDEMLSSIADENRYNPWHDYLAACELKYDGRTDYIGQLCDTIKSGIPECAKRLYIEKNLVQMACVGTSGEDDQTSQDILVVLIGAPGIGKSRWFEKLLPESFSNQGYFMGNYRHQVDSKKAIRELHGKLLIEWVGLESHYDGFSGISRKYDSIRHPLYKGTAKIKRHMCLCASMTNNIFKTKENESRYFAMIDCKEIDSEHNVDMDGVWGQVWRLKLNGPQYSFTKVEIEELRERNKSIE